MNKFAERLKELREESGLSLIQFGNKIGISDASISRWENNKADIKSENLIILCKFFGVSADYLLGLED